ncbi:septum formation family protein [Dactylosporangium salmoneum]|uniref:Septum formation-related domain-containing protein n=1 Tax=Dactylosporangium salmoneum TaxID=53361 RepID=A0ABP5UGH8_9ACTN
MKRIAVAAVSVALVGLLGGCGITAGDGDLTDDWAMLPAAKVPEPEAGFCWSTKSTEASSRAIYLDRTTCDVTHTFETVKVGHFTGSAASGSTAPEGAELKDAWADCDKAAGDYLGGDWQSGRVFVTVTRPTSAEWHGGARFYSCNVAAVRTEAGEFDPRRDSMKGSLAGDGKLRLGCGSQVGTTSTSWDDISPVACTDAHDVEYVGWVSSPSDTYPTDDKSYDAAFGKTCEAKMLSYIGMSRSHLASQRALYYGYWMTSGKDEWAAGNHTARCYLMLDKKKINRSLKGAGDTTV